jgi:glyoxylase-like metal-dependent hydrolase (beta-lactamase superfamily II)
VSDKVYLLDTHALGNPGTVAVYVLKGSKVALVDCGYASSYEVILEELSEIGISPSEVRYLIPTHVHLDHAGGAGHLLKHMPKAELIAHERAVPHLVDPTRLVQSAASIFGEEMVRSYGPPIPINQERITAVGQEMHLDLGGLSITAMYAPGHAPHEISILVEEEKLLLSADAVGIVYPSIATMIPTTPPPSLDPLKLAETVSKLAQLDYKKLLVPHYGVRDDVVNVLETTKNKTEGWLSQVRELRKNGVSLDKIIDEFQEEIVGESGVSTQDFPAYARLSIRITLMGMLHYLEKNP